MEFKDKIILVTGASSGIGQVAAQLFAQEGGTVIVADINEKGGQETVKSIEENNGKAVFIKTNVARFEEVEKLMENILTQFGRLDIAVNNAGISGNIARTADTRIEDWDKVIAVNASSVFYCMKLEIQQMLKQESGIILNTSSIAGLRGLPNSFAYCASKHAVIGMTKTAAMEYAKKNIRINAICPVFTVTPLFNPEVIDQMIPGMSEKFKKNIPMKRFAEPSEVAQAMLWLCSEKASFVTGQAMPVDGGITA